MMNKKIFVTEAGYDDIGSILSSLGEGYKHQVLEWVNISFNKLSTSDTLFINCHSSCLNSSEKYKKQLRNFVSGGGILYASDWAGALIAESFGDYLEFSDDGESETINAKVVDEGLKEILGGQIALNFDMGGWWKIIKIKKDVKKFLTYQNKPLLVSFKVDRGYVLYTSFHNKSQVSKLEKALLEYLVFRPLLSKVADQASQKAVSANYEIDKEIISSTKSSQTQSLVYSISIDKPTTILSILSWEGTATFEVALEDPQNGLVKKVVSDKSPCGIEHFVQKTGNWVVRINPLNIPYPNFPFAVTLAKGGEKQQLTSNFTDASTKTQSAFSSGKSSQVLPVAQMSSLQPASPTVSNPVSGNTPINGIRPAQNTKVAPTMFPILNMGGLPNFEVRWISQAGQDGYILQEAGTISFQNAKEIYKGNLTSFVCANRSVGSYYYRICSYKGAESSPWSETQTTQVLHDP